MITSGDGLFPFWLFFSFPDLISCNFLEGGYTRMTNRAVRVKVGDDLGSELRLQITLRSET